MEEEKYQNWLKKIKEFSQKDKIDLSSDEDLSLAVMNLISIEEHFFFTGAKTGKGEYYDLLNQTREMRKDLMKKIVKNPEGEIWCISKHLLSASMRLIEVGTKYFNQNKKREAEDLFSKAYNLYSLFWGINLKLVDIGEIKRIDDKKFNLFNKLGDIVKKVIDCCIE